MRADHRAVEPPLTRAGGEPRPRRIYAKTATRKRQIVEAATAVFASKGYNGGSLREIATQIDVALTSLVHHFPQKIDLLQAVLEHADNVGNGPFHDNCRTHGLRYGVLDLVERNFDHPELLRLLAVLATECSAPDHPGHMWFVERYERSRADFSAKFAFDQARGLVPASLDPADLAEGLISVWDGAQLQWLIDPSRNRMVAMMELYLNSIGATSVN